MENSNPNKIRRRLPRQERERLIVDEAVKFFAEVGFEGQTRALAQRLGVTQPLLYRYFPDKESLVERVYQEVFIGGWETTWSELLADRSRPLVERLSDFYVTYTKRNFNYERVRLFMFAGLKDQAIGTRYLKFVRDNLFVPVCRELRAEIGLPSAPDCSENEIECVAGLHGAITYIGVRRWVYQVPMQDDMEVLVLQQVTAFMHGAPAAMRGTYAR